MPRPRQNSDEQILAVMRARVLEHGPAVSLESVAADLHVSVPALLKRFGSRQALMLAALKPPESPGWLTRLNQGPGDGPLEQQLLEVFTRISDFMREVVPCITALRESGIAQGEIFSSPAQPQRPIKALQKWLAAARKRGLVTVDAVDTAAFAIIGALQTRAFLSHVLKVKYSEREQREFLRELARFFTHALTR